MLNNYEGTVLFWLLSATGEQDNLSVHIASLQKVINDTRVLFDADQCIDDLASITDLTIFLVLGPTRSDLLPILQSFDYLRHIYLSEPHEYAQNTAQVRGVFRTIEDLLPHLTKDVRMAQQTDSHLIITYMGEPTQSLPSMADLQSAKADFNLRQALIDIALNIAAPLEKNIHKDLIDEWRLVYRSNTAETKHIDEFEATYDPSNAIHWYTRNTFLYKMVNMALRTENIVIIWRLRFFIQDMYRQLQRLHKEQREAFIGTPQHIHTLYRGQRLSASELVQLKKCVGGSIAMSSFVSTTRNPQVAESFAGNGEGRPDIESVIFEILVDDADQDYGRSLFADISDFSINKHEEEVLLCLGTTFRVESLETEEQMTRVRVRMYPREENEAQRQLATGFDKFINPDYIRSDQIALYQLALILLCANESVKAEQIVKIIQSSIGPSRHPLEDLQLETLLLYIQAGRLGMSTVDGFSLMLVQLRKTSTVLQSLIYSPLSQGLVLDASVACKSYCDGISEIIEAGADPSSLLKFCVAGIDLYPESMRINQLPLWQMMLKKTIKPALEEWGIDDQTQGPTTDNTLRAYRDETFSEKDQGRISWCSHLSKVAEKQENYEEAIRFLREGLSVPCSKAQPIVALCICLESIYFRQSNWVAALECCQYIINMPQLPPNSPHIVKAYMDCGFLCRQLNDYSEALLYYTKALELQHQHNPPRHPCAAEIYVQVGILFYAVADTATAIEHFQSAIALDFPESSSKAHHWIALTYKRMKQCDEARSHLLKSLDIRQRHFPSETVQLVHTYRALIEIEHITGNHQERDRYLQCVQRVAESSDEARDLLHEETQRILEMTGPATQ